MKIEFFFSPKSVVNQSNVVIPFPPLCSQSMIDVMLKIVQMKNQTSEVLPDEGKRIWLSFCLLFYTGLAVDQYSGHKHNSTLMKCLPERELHLTVVSMTCDANTT